MTDHGERSDSDDHFESDRATDHRWDGATPASTAVVKAVATATGCDPMELPVLTEAVDTDALNTLFSRRPDGQHPSVGMSFGYAGVEVCLRRDGRVVVES